MTIEYDVYRFIKIKYIRITFVLLKVKTNDAETNQ